MDINDIKKLIELDRVNVYVMKECDSSTTLNEDDNIFYIWDDNSYILKFEKKYSHGWKFNRDEELYYFVPHKHSICEQCGKIGIYKKKKICYKCWENEDEQMGVIDIYDKV